MILIRALVVGQQIQAWANTAKNSSLDVQPDPEIVAGLNLACKTSA